jgi:organic hydroperoxide reductase OsmC/OhrA
MPRAKEFRFPVAVEWQGGPLTVATIEGKPDLPVATPAELGSGVQGVWSPEDLLVASAATCLAVTLSAVARRRGITLTSMRVAGTGHLGPRKDGGLGFTSIELDVSAETETPSRSKQPRKPSSTQSAAASWRLRSTCRCASRPP